jgi:hypothetical protein
MVSRPTALLSAAEGTRRMVIIGLHEEDETVEHVIAETALHTTNVPRLMERCHRAWEKKEPMRFFFKDYIGLEHSIPIISAIHHSFKDGSDGIILGVVLPVGLAREMLPPDELGHMT